MALDEAADAPCEGLSKPGQLGAGRCLHPAEPQRAVRSLDIHPDYDPQSGEPLYDLEWAEIFRDDGLRDLIVKALENNRDMLQAIERIEEARADSVVARSALFPQVDLELQGEREDESKLTNDNPDQTDEFFFGPSVAWELDLWGRNRRASEAGFRRYLAAEYGARAVRLSLIAEVSSAYFDLQAEESLLQINMDTLRSRERALQIARKRHSGGLTSLLEVKQSEVELAQSRAQIPQLEQSKLKTENRLAILLGEPPTHRALDGELHDQYVPPTVAAGLPAELLRRRPDVLQAEQELRAASEAVGIATAGLLPGIRLTASGGSESDDFDALLDSDAEFWILNLDVSMPLFNAGARRAQLTAAESRFNQSRLAYEQSVLEALREVSDSLNQFYLAGGNLAALSDLERASAEYLALARKRYRNGVLAYIDVLDAQRRLLDAQVGVTEARRVQLKAVVELYKALGGGWDPAPLEEVAASR